MTADQFVASTKKTRGIGQATGRLRDYILAAMASGDGGAWTVRQVFYAVSVAGGVDKTEAGYRQVQRQVLLMRRQGLIAYSLIADNTRWVRQPATYSSLTDWIDESLRSLKIDLWRDSGERVEVWLEKDAVAGVVIDVTRQWHVPLFVTRGYASESFAFEAAHNALADGRPFTIFYLGDFDASGVHMARDLEQRIAGFLGRNAALLTFDRIAVNPDQITALGLPSRPNKTTDVRHLAFAQEFPGLDATELDAMRPDTLRDLVRRAVESKVNRDLVEGIRQEQAMAADLARQLASSIRSQPGV